MADESLSQAEFDSWTPLPAAYHRVLKVLGYDGAKTEICRRLVSGTLRAAASVAFIDDRQEILRLIGSSIWRQSPPSDHANMWQSGSYDFVTGRPYNAADWQLQGVRVETSGVDRLLVDAGESIPLVNAHEVASAVNRGGRPPKPFWEDMWAAIAAQLYDGALKPTKQADIESAVHDWLVGNSHDAGTTQVRDRARKLWNLLKD